MVASSPTSSPSATTTFDFLASAPHQRGEMSVESIKRDFAGHLRYSLARDRYTATDRNLFYSLALTVRDRLMQRWIRTQQTHHEQRAKRVYYLSLEYLMGRALLNNVINLSAEETFAASLRELDLDLTQLSEIEVDAGLGNGGLGRLAACFIDSLATLDLPAIGYGLRYDYGIFTQTIKDGHQFEKPDDWLRHGNPWELARPEYAQLVRFGGHVEAVSSPGGTRYEWMNTDAVVGLPYDMPIVGYGCNTVNNLRLWSAKARQEFDFHDFNRGDYFGAVEDKNSAENITKVLYPNDNNYEGKTLRFRQQYFFVSCSLQDILRRFLADKQSFDALPDRLAIQLNDTHPAMAVPELMRLLMDEHHLAWDQAWDITQRATGYTNHTLMPEALEQWPVEFFEKLLPRHLQIIFEINRRFLRTVQTRHPFDDDRLRRMSLIQEGDGAHKSVRMAHLSIVGSRSVNGVAALHTELLKKFLFRDFHELWPERFNNKTNGITPRRWLRLANPELATLITSRIGDGWLTDLDKLKKLDSAAEDKVFRQAFRTIKFRNKERLARIIQQETGVVVSPEAIFDVQVKRLHEYKRQLMNTLHIIMLYNRLKKNPGLSMAPHVFIFGGKSAPGYFLAKLIVKLVHCLADVINSDDLLQGKLKVVFLPNYGVSMAEKIIPAADVSQQISTAGMEASGTGNMKFALNGALTVGTLDGANIEIREEVGPDNIFIFGLTADEVAERRADRHEHPARYYSNDEEIRETCDLLFRNFFNMDEPGIFEPLRQRILDNPDPFMNLADLRAYADAMERVDTLYRTPDEWDRRAILNVARMGKFSSDRTIREYNRDIWHVKPVPIPDDSKG
ncbi:MAG: glycogen/starch/alpha-glucan phosphorylase [Pseudomonadota bacterium]